jgi:hypothetical protein
LGSIVAANVLRAAPFAVFLPATSPPSVRVVRVAGIPVPSNPTGRFQIPADVTIEETGNIIFDIEARNIPPTTVVRLHLFSDNGPDQTVESTPLSEANNEGVSTATAEATLPTGFTQGLVRATWTP